MAGLAVAVAIGVLVALFPLYSDRVADKLWTPGGGEAEELRVRGTVESLDPEAGVLRVSGVELAVKGSWTLQLGGEVREVESSELLSMLGEDTYVEVVYKETGRWGALALSIEAPGLGLSAWKSG